MSTRLIVKKHWSPVPDWVMALAKSCDDTSQNKTAKLIRYSTTVVNQILKNNYRGSLDAVEQAVRGALMHYTVDCPVLGEIYGNECRAHQRAKFAPTNATRVRLYTSCRTCKHSNLTAAKDYRDE